MLGLGSTGDHSCTIQIMFAHDYTGSTGNLQANSTLKLNYAKEDGKIVSLSL